MGIPRWVAETQYVIHPLLLPRAHVSRKSEAEPGLELRHSGAGCGKGNPSSIFTTSANAHPVLFFCVNSLP